MRLARMGQRKRRCLGLGVSVLLAVGWLVGARFWPDAHAEGH